MKTGYLFICLLLAMNIYAQGFVRSPYQDFQMVNQLVADFTGDEKPDVLGVQVSFSGPDKVVLQVNNGAVPLTFSQKPLGLNIDVYGFPVAADMDGDMDMDIIVADGAGLQLYLLRNDGAGNFTPDSLGISGSDILRIADIDMDTDLDIIGVNDTENTLNLYLNDGNLNFTVQNIPNNSGNIDLLEVDDLDGDNDQDILLGLDQSTGDHIVLYKNNGSNNFEKKVVAANSYSSIEGLLIDDIDSDGKKDILAIRTNYCDAFLNKDNLSFEKKSVAAINDFLISVQTGDYNGDGLRDVIIGTNSNGISWYKNLSNTTLEFEKLTVGGVAPAYSIVNSDLDNDNDIDIVVTNGDFWWYENTIEQGPVGTVDLSQNQAVVFPNPFKDVIYLKNLKTDFYRFEIFDLLGKKLYASEIRSDSVDLSTLNPGTYMLLLINKSAGQSISKLILKQE